MHMEKMVLLGLVLAAGCLTGTTSHATVKVVMFPDAAKRAMVAAYADRFAEAGVECVRFKDDRVLAELVRDKGDVRLGFVGFGTGGRDALVALASLPTGRIDFVITDGLRGVLDKDGRLAGPFRLSKGVCSMCLIDSSDAVPGFRESTELYRQLRRLKAPSEVHVVDVLGENAGLGDHADRAIEFLRARKFLPRLGAVVEIMTRVDDGGRARVVREDLWPEGSGKIYKKGDVPYLEWNFPTVRTTDAIQILYGGGGYYANRIEGRECDPVRCYLNDKGVTVVTLHYRTPPMKGAPKHLAAWQDLQRTIRLVKRGARSFGLDPERVGIMGFSAGGHLTLMGALSSKTEAYSPLDEADRLSVGVQWAVSIYPAYALTDGMSKANTRGGNEDEDVPVPEFAFDGASCPVFFMHGDADIWSAMSSVKVFERLRDMGVRSEVHTLAGREHCFQYSAEPGTLSYRYFDVIYGFLSGFLKAQ